jgi:hypothetical protein
MAPRVFRWPFAICVVLLLGALGSIVVQPGVAAAAVPTWSIVPTPNPVSKASQLSGVSCFAATQCTAVGHFYNGTDDQTLVESWAGTSWSIAPSPNPGGSTGAYLDSVSCVSSTYCTAVGDYDVTGTTDTVQALIESWNGTGWSIVPSPSTGGSGSSKLLGVFCVSATNCTAVGSDQIIGISNGIQTLVESWNGTSWSIVPSPNPSDSSNGSLQGVSCLSTTNCTAVGGYYNGGADLTLVESWDGTAWSIVPSPNVQNDASNLHTSYLNGVSCVNSTSCTAVGYFNSATGEQSLVESWDGTTWSIPPSPNVTGDTASVLSGVSCASATSCVAVGRATGSTTPSLIESWDGTTWSMIPSPKPHESSLSGVSCVSVANCTGVGYFLAGGLTDETLIVRTSPTFISASGVTFTENVSSTFTPNATGDPAPSITESGALPSGLHFTGGKLHGTPTVHGTFHVRFTASNRVLPNAVQNFTITVLGLHVVTTTLASGAIVKPYSATLSAIGGTPPYAWAVVTSGGQLPIGLHLSAGGVLHGTPGQRGTLTFDVRVSDQQRYGAQSATALITLKVS